MLDELALRVSAYGTIGIDQCMHKLTELIRPRTKEVLTNRRLTKGTIMLSYLYSSSTFLPKFVLKADEGNFEPVVEEACKYIAFTARSTKNSLNELRLLLGGAFLSDREMITHLRKTNSTTPFVNITYNVYIY